MFLSWVDAVVFGIIATFFTGVLASVIARADLKTVKSRSK
ncbi:hypothetical protein Ga0451573_000260 [Peptococcaceae bacterium DYL19]|nr:hypothetical protein [Phosphitispora fastidiosa]